MAEQTFRAPGYRDREIVLVQPTPGPIGTPAGIIGTAKQGPAFVPMIVGSSNDFEQIFGGLDPKKAGPYAVNEYLKHQSAVTYMRVLGGGANDTVTDINNTRLTGQVKNAGFVVTGTTVDTQDPRHQGATQFIVARHDLATNEAIGMPLFTDNDSFVATSASDFVNLVRAVVLTASGTRLMILNGDEATPTNLGSNVDDVASLSNNEFKLIVSSSAKQTVLTASLDPDSSNYISKILNTNPENFPSKEHLLYADFAVDNQIATVDTNGISVAVVSGSTATSDSSGNTTMPYRDAYGHFDTRYRSSRTTNFISQPFGDTEFDLFYIEALDDGEETNEKWKVSIADVRMSNETNNEYGTFSVLIRRFDDTDQVPEIIERYTGCNLNPLSEDYVAAKIGDIKAQYIWDAEDEDDRRVEITGKYSNKSRIVRVVMNEAVERREVPARALPFGFRGLSVLKTNPDNVDTGSLASSDSRLGIVGSSGLGLTSSIVPPVPFRFKVTRGSVSTSGFAGNPGSSEEVDGRLYWGVKFERNTTPLNPNITKKQNKLVASLAKLAGIEKLDVLVTGSTVDSFNENKFTLARVAFSNAAVSEITGTAQAHMKEAAYIRNGNPNFSGSVSDGVLTNRITLGTLVAETGSAKFNKFTTYNKFTNMMYGGWDGLNVLDKNSARMNDKGSSSDTGGSAASAFTAPGLSNNPAGTGKNNNSVVAYRTAAKIMTDPFTSPANLRNGPGVQLLAIPGIRDSFITDYVADLTKDYGLAFYVMDIAGYDDSTTRLYDISSDKPDVEKTAEQFDSRAINNNYSAAYFPDLIITDSVNNRTVKVPPSVGVMGAIAFNDKVGFPWFAPAGFNRGSLDFVESIDVRLKKDDRATLHDARINPIANFPPQIKVIFGQRTLQQAASALDRVNVRRLLIAVKRTVSDAARRLVFEQPISEQRDRFVSIVTPILSLVQLQAGIEGFNIIANDSNNSAEDEEANKMNGIIELIPTRTAEKISIDFVIDDSGVTFNE